MLGWDPPGCPLAMTAQGDLRQERGWVLSDRVQEVEGASGANKQARDTEAILALSLKDPGSDPASAAFYKLFDCTSEFLPWNLSFHICSMEFVGHL